MRDPDRIQNALSAIERIWSKYPDMRLGQLVTNIADWADQPIWDLEVDALVAEIERHLLQREQNESGVPQLSTSDST